MAVQALKTDLDLVKTSQKLSAFRWAYRASLAVNCVRLVGDFALAGCSLLASHDRDAFLDRMSTSMRHRLNPLNGTYTRALDILQKTQSLTDPEILALSKGFRPVLVPYEKIYNEKIVPAVNKIFGDGSCVCLRDTSRTVREVLAHEPLCGDGEVQRRSCTIPSLRKDDPPVHLSQLVQAGRELSLHVFQWKEGGIKDCLHLNSKMTVFAKDFWVAAVQQEAVARREGAAVPAPSYGAQAAAPT